MKKEGTLKERWPHRLGQLERLKNHFGMEKFKERNEAARECGESSMRSTDFDVT